MSITIDSTSEVLKWVQEAFRNELKTRLEAEAKKIALELAVKGADSVKWWIERRNGDTIIAVRLEGIK